MPLVADQCICLRKLDYSETSQILLLFAREHGLLRVIAKGAHRRTKAGASKFDGGIDLLDLGDAVFTHEPTRDLNTLKEWHLTDGHLDLRSNLRATYLGQYAAELVSTLIEEHDAHQVLFDRLVQTIPQLAGACGEEMFLCLQLDLLRETGYLPELSACSECGGVLQQNEPPYFSPARGGVVCRNCEGATPDRLNLDFRLLRLIQTVLKLPRANGFVQRLPRLSRHQTDPVNRLLADHIEHTLGRRLRLPKYVM